jgi:hypothetical protein
VTHLFSWLANLQKGYRYIIEVTTGGVIITDAIKYVQGQMEHLNNQENQILRDIRDRGKVEEHTNDIKDDDVRTTNGVLK